jgi:hypothetical protein
LKGCLKQTSLDEEVKPLQKVMKEYRKEKAKAGGHSRG